MFKKIFILQLAESLFYIFTFFKGITMPVAYIVYIVAKSTFFISFVVRIINY